MNIHDFDDLYIRDPEKLVPVTSTQLKETILRYIGYAITSRNSHYTLYNTYMKGGLPPLLVKE